MIKLSNLILEKFDIPADLQKQLENTGYSALGYILSPHLDKFKKKLLQNKEFNDKVYSGLKNVFTAIRMMTQGTNVGNSKITYTGVFIPEYFSITTAKEVTKKIKVTIERTHDEIYITSDEKKDKQFPNILISKDYAGWDLHKLNEFWKELDQSYHESKNEFDDKFVMIEDLKRRIEYWKTLDKPIKSKTNVEGQEMTIEFQKKTLTGDKYDHYFRVVPSKTVDTYDSPDHFLGGDEPHIVQTIYLDQFNMDLISINFFMSYIKKFIETTRHEGRHLIQYYGDKERQIKAGSYGGPKKSLGHSFDTNIRGVDYHGTAGKNSTQKEPNDKWNRVMHPYRDVEFKTNLHSYEHDIENVLQKNYPRREWPQAFKSLLLFSIGKEGYSEFRKKFPHSIGSWEYSTTKNHIEKLYTHDRLKFNRYVSELYKLLFV